MKNFRVTAYDKENKTLGMFYMEAYTINYALADSGAEIAMTWRDDIIDQIKCVQVAEIEQ